MGCCNENNLCDVPIIKECSRNGDAVGAWGYVFENTDISDMLFFYQSEYLQGKQIIKKSLGNGLTLVKSDPELSYFDTLVFDATDNDIRLAGKHSAYLKVVENEDEPSTIIQFAITIKKKEVLQP